MAPASANASLFGKKTKSDASTAQSQATGIDVQVVNRGQIPQDLKMGGQTYTVQPHKSLTIKAAAGTSVYADSTGKGFSKGDVLFTLAPSMKGATVNFN